MSLALDFPAPVQRGILPSEMPRADPTASAPHAVPPAWDPGRPPCSGYVRMMGALPVSRAIAAGMGLAKDPAFFPVSSKPERSWAASTAADGWKSSFGDFRSKCCGNVQSPLLRIVGSHRAVRCSAGGVRCTRGSSRISRRGSGSASYAAGTREAAVPMRGRRLSEDYGYIPV